MGASVINFNGDRVINGVFHGTFEVGPIVSAGTIHLAVEEWLPSTCDSSRGLSPDTLSVHVDAADLHVEVSARRGPGIPFRSALFPTLDETSAFFQKDAVGWSPTRSGTLEGLRLDTDAWRVEPLSVTHLESSFFDALPRDAVAFDHALLMRDVPTRWSSPAESPPIAAMLVR